MAATGKLQALVQIAILLAEQAETRLYLRTSLTWRTRSSNFGSGRPTWTGSGRPTPRT